MRDEQLAAPRPAAKPFVLGRRSAGPGPDGFTADNERCCPGRPPCGLLQIPLTGIIPSHGYGAMAKSVS